jgi:hypothetical protein
MTVPSERTRAVVQTKVFLEALLDPKRTPRTPGKVRYWAKTLLRHYPEAYQIQDAHEALPYLFGPVEPGMRLRASGRLDAIDDTKDGEP